MNATMGGALPILRRRRVRRDTNRERGRVHPWDSIPSTFIVRSSLRHDERAIGMRANHEEAE
jgi:hypothetical protein